MLDQDPKTDLVDLPYLLFDNCSRKLADIATYFLNISLASYLINKLRQQGLDAKGPDVVFNSLILSKLSYVCHAVSGFWTEFDASRLLSSLNKANRWKLSSVNHDMKQIFERADSSLFNKIVSYASHCLRQYSPLLPDSHGRSMRSRGRRYKLRSVHIQLHKSSFIVKC
jgi:hypothetical protein